MNNLTKVVPDAADYQNELVVWCVNAIVTVASVVSVGHEEEKRREVKE